MDDLSSLLTILNNSKKLTPSDAEYQVLKNFIQKQQANNTEMLRLITELQNR